MNCANTLKIFSILILGTVIFLSSCARNGKSFSKQVIDYGPAGTGSGCGIYFHAVDINNNGLIDIVAPGKDGLHLFQNLGIT